MDIYVDNAATTKMSQTAIQAMLPYMEEEFGNAFSLYKKGQRAMNGLVKARETVANCLNCLPREIIFTSGGSEADNQALISAAIMGKEQGKNHIISTKFEHHAILHTLSKLEKFGFEVTLLEVGEDGIITPQQVDDAMTSTTCLVTIMYANNEIGTVQPIAQIGAICRNRKVIFHTDAVQAAGHIPMDVQKQNIDMLSLSAHKFHGPKGVGVLYARKGLAISPLIEGGGQEHGKRAGTENVAGIVGLSTALEEACVHMNEHTAHMMAMRNYLIEELSKIPNSVVNGDKTHRLPNNINLSFEGIEGETLLLLLDEKGISVSSGSACASGSLNPSHVLLAIGRSEEMARGSIRISLCKWNTMDEMNQIIVSVKEAVSHLRKGSPACLEQQCCSSSEGCAEE